MKAKRKGPRYWTPADPRGIVDSHRGHRLSFDEIARLLNAGERAKAEVRRLKAKLRALNHRHILKMAHVAKLSAALAHPRNECTCDTCFNARSA